jgi:hypothetical protein
LCAFRLFGDAQAIHGIVADFDWATHVYSSHNARIGCVKYARRIWRQSARTEAIAGVHDPEK